MSVSNESPETWTPETADKFENAWKQDDFGWDIMVREFGSPDPNIDNDAFFAWLNEKLESLITYRIETGNNVELLREEERQLSETWTAYELGFKVDGEIYNMLDAPARRMKALLEKRLGQDRSHGNNHENNNEAESDNSGLRALDQKLDPHLRRVFAQAAAGEIPMDRKVYFRMQAREGYESENVEIMSRIGNIMTAGATLEQIKELVKDNDVDYLEMSRNSFSL